MTLRITLTKVSTENGCKQIEKWLSDSTFQEAEKECVNHLVAKNKNYEVNIVDHDKFTVVRLHINEKNCYKFVINEFDAQEEWYTKKF